MKIEDIHKEVADLFKKYKYPWLTLNLSMENLHQWSMITSRRLKLNEEDFQCAVTELFWSLSHVQLALGYMLIARESSQFPRGIKGTSYQVKDIPLMLEIPEIHFRYHSSCGIECIYRCWERMASILLKACYPKCIGKFYFDEIVNKIRKDEKYNKNPKLHDLEKQIKHWNKIAGMRNNLSHKASSPFKDIKIEGTVANIYGPRGRRIPKFNYSSKNLVEETNKIKDEYLKLLPAMKAVNEFVDKI